MTTASDYLGEVVLYGGLPVRRGEMEAHLDRLGVTGPARLVYARLPAVDLEPVPLEETENLNSMEDTDVSSEEATQGTHAR